MDRIAQFQTLRADGTLIYSEGSITLSSDTAYSKIGIISSEFFCTIFSWSVPGEVNSIYAQIYDTSGNKLWGEEGVIVAHPALSYQTYTTDGNYGFIIGGLINDFTVVLQQVSKYGNLGEIITSLDQEYQEIFLPEPILYQNFPNPFNSSTLIQFQLPKENKISVELYNALGEKIQTIVNGFYSKGMHSINFSGEELSSGVYLYKLSTETIFLIKKLIIIK